MGPVRSPTVYTYLCTCTWINDCESTHYHLKCTCTVHTYGKLFVSILVLQLMIIFRTPLSTNFDILMCFCYQKQYFRRLIKSNERSVLLTWFMGQKPHFLTMLQVTYVFHFFQPFTRIRLVVQNHSPQWLCKIHHVFFLGLVFSVVQDLYTKIIYSVTQ